MDSALITGMAAVLGSLAGTSSSIATTWMTQRNQKVRERAREELHRRETLYGEFITETARLTADSFEHSLERPEALANVYAALGRIRLVGSAPVVEAAEECCHYVVEMYSKPNLTIEQVYDWFRAGKHPLRNFAAACRLELDQYVIH
ncbi:MAG TPA: hypothetical protein VNU68_29680 [Verrucomicrobiae bacterium]|nr:hypothetical protein [Verrucomicrobiae bacterium]